MGMTTHQEEAPMAETFYFCLTHHRVEGEGGCKAADRLGPYESADEAEHALERVEQRNEAWDDDPEWNDDADRT